MTAVLGSSRPSRCHPPLLCVGRGEYDRIARDIHNGRDHLLLPWLAKRDSQLVAPANLLYLIANHGDLEDQHVGPRTDRSEERKRGPTIHAIISLAQRAPPSYRFSTGWRKSAR